MRGNFLWLLAIPLSLSGASIAVADQSEDEAAIRANADKYVEAYNRRDSKSMASMWSPEAVYMDPSTGEGVVGWEAIAKQLDYVFAGAEDAKLTVTVDSIDFLSPNVAIEKGIADITYSESEPEKFEYSAVHVKRDGQWLLDRVSETQVPAPPPTHYEQLKELEWMVGSWIDDNEGALIQTDCEWTKNKNFLTRSFAVMIGDRVDMSGMQIIGWDPAAKQIRSWVFDSDGTFAEGQWTRNGDTWSIKQVGTLPDGKKSTAVNIITKIDDNSCTWQSINRATDGEVQPNVEEVLIVRKPTVTDVVIDVDVEAEQAAAESAGPSSSAESGNSSE
ncbi:MAG: SgcJ/EcaC family oxidoreductase [Planctomycetes bacterium]|nr:SgcJ/EcaC family oxidoreductase [Planctomycetota bacterium]